MKPIALSSPDGKVYAYACSACHHVAAGSSLLYAPCKGPIKELVESSLLKATACCACHTCGKRVKRGTRGITCEECERWRRWRIAWGDIGVCVMRGITGAEQWMAWQMEDDDDVG